MITWLVSEQGSNFKNKLMARLAAEFHNKHHFFPDYSRRENVTVEMVFREILRTFEAQCIERALSPREWQAVTECIQSVLNHAPLKRLGLHDIVLARKEQEYSGHLWRYSPGVALPDH